MMHPYNVLKKKNCRWLDSLTEQVTRSITEYDEFIMAEAEADKCIDFARESFLYERFVDNNFYGMDWCNLEVLKYFVLYFEQKILYNMIGEWKFTKHDKEMYNHFIDTKFHVTRNMGKLIIHYHKKSPEYIGDRECAKDWVVSLMMDDKRLIKVNYVDWFVDQFVACNDMIRNVKHLCKYYDDIRLFTNVGLFNIYDMYNYVGFKFEPSRICLI